MASIIVNRGLQTIVGRASGTADGFAAWQSISVDDSATALTAGTTTLGSPVNVETNDFDATPTRSAQTVTHLVTFTTAEANFEIKRIVIHNAAAASVTGASTTVVAGVDGQSITKTSGFALELELRHTATDNS